MVDVQCRERTSAAGETLYVVAGGRMAQGSKKKYSNKQVRKAEHIAEGYSKRGTSKKEAKRRAWATVNKDSGGGEKSGSGRGKKTSKASSKKGGRKGGAAKKGKKKGAKKAARTRAKKAGKKRSGKKKSSSKKKRTKRSTRRSR
ncbi:MAG TPA: hypothetical protein VG755_28450 [Nannocystaceae bacterium]|nr:hypothetical protein [Nannocystaceae bacterium]